MAIESYRGRGRLPRIGKIHLGVKAVNDRGVEYPKAVDYFVCPDEITAVYGPKPQELRVMFLQNDIDQVASLYFRAYGKGTGLVCRGDGETANAVLDSDAWARAKGRVQAGIWATSESKKTERQTIPCAGEGVYGVGACPHYDAKKCRRVLILQVVVLGAPRLGVYQIDTGSYYGTVNILGWLEMIQGVFGGRIAGLPMILRLVPQEVTADGKKKTVRVLQLTAEGDAERFLQLATMPIQQAIANGNRLALPEGKGEEVIEGDVIPPDEESIGHLFAEPDELPPEPAEVPATEATPVAGIGPTTQGGTPGSTALSMADRVQVAMTEMDVSITDLAAFLVCDPTDVIQGIKDWVKAESGRTVKSCLEAAKAKAEGATA
jgi:hypothetical protein